MTLAETIDLSKIKLSITLIEDGVAWLESDDHLTTADVPVKYNIDDRSFEITKDCECYLCHENTISQFFLAKCNNEILMSYLEQTDMGLEIQAGQIFYEATKH